MRFSQLNTQPSEILLSSQRFGRRPISGHQKICHHSAASLLDYNESLRRIAAVFSNHAEMLFIQVAHTFNESRLSEHTVSVADHYILNRSGSGVRLIGLGILLSAHLNLCQDIQQLWDQGDISERLC